MATLEDLFDGGELERFEPVLDVGEHVWRFVYLLPGASRWLEANPGTGIRHFEDGVTAMRGVMSSYCAGHRLIVGLEVRHLKPKEDWVCEFKSKPPDAVRAFGWVYDRCTFIVAFFKLKKDISQGYADEVEQTLKVRDQLPLDEPKILKERNLDKLVGRVAR